VEVLLLVLLFSKTVYCSFDDTILLESHVSLEGTQILNEIVLSIMENMKMIQVYIFLVNENNITSNKLKNLKKKELKGFTKF